jgi:hypothetical protein
MYGRGLVPALSAQINLFQEGIQVNKTKWWLRIVGGFYLFLTVGSLGVLFVNSQLFGEMFPFAADPQSVRAFSDAWLIFVLEMAVLGVIMLYASWKSPANSYLIATVAVLELVRGAGGDFLWMLRGWPTANYIPFMILHLIIGISGIVFLRQERAAQKAN